MKKSIVLAFVSIALMLSGVAFASDMANPCNAVTLGSLRQQVPIPPATILSKKAVAGMCEVILDIRGQYVPVYAGPDYVIAGEMFKDRKQVTQETITGLRAKRFRALKNEVDKCVAMTLKSSSGKVDKTVYMITDPVCPYCHRAETRLREFADRYGAEFKLVLYSVHPPVGRRKAVEAVCRGLSAEAYLDGKWKQENLTDKYQCKAGAGLIKRTEELVRKMGVRGVPMFYLSDGTLVQGANMPALARALSSEKLRVSSAK